MNDLLLHHTTQKSGFIAFPQETKEQYELRVHHFLASRSKLEKEAMSLLGYGEQDRDDDSSLLLNHLAREQFGISLFRLPIFATNRGLWVWNAASCWIYEDGEDALPLIQLRKRLSAKGSYCGYSKREILLHELCHALRHRFQEPLYEERIASMGMRRAVFTHLCVDKASRWIALFCACSWLFGIWFFFPWIALIAHSIYREVIFRNCERRIGHLIIDQVKRRFFILHLTDEEIHAFAQCDFDIASYLASRASREERIQQMIALLRV